MQLGLGYVILIIVSLCNYMDMFKWGPIDAIRRWGAGNYKFMFVSFYNDLFNADLVIEETEVKGIDRVTLHVTSFSS